MRVAVFTESKPSPCFGDPAKSLSTNSVLACKWDETV